MAKASGSGGRGGGRIGIYQYNAGITIAGHQIGITAFGENGIDRDISLTTRKFIEKEYQRTIDPLLKEYQVAKVNKDTEKVYSIYSKIKREEAKIGIAAANLEFKK